MTNKLRLGASLVKVFDGEICHSAVYQAWA